MSDIPNFDRPPMKYVVIERVASGRWLERARFAEATDAGDYAIWRSRHYGAIFAAIGFETLVVTAPNTATEDVTSLAERHPPQPSASQFERGPVTPDEAGDGRLIGRASPFDS